MTNILATIVVTLVTNVTTTDNHRGCYSCWEKSRHPFTLEYRTPHDHIGQDLDPLGGYTPATDKTETIITTEVKTLVFNFQGQPFNQIFSEKEISRRQKKFTLKPAEWIAGDEIVLPPQATEKIHRVVWPINVSNLVVKTQPL